MFKHVAGFAIALLLAVFIWRPASADTKGHFPTGALDPRSAESDNFKNSWYSKHLRAMSEPILTPIDGTRTYRFTWLRTFHHPVAVRIVATSDHAKLFATELDGAGGYDPGHVLRKKDISLTSDQLKKLEELEEIIQQNGFWNLPSRGETMGLDGSEWILEGVTDKYHVAIRWTPTPGPIREIGERFLSLTGWHYKSEEVY